MKSFLEYVATNIYQQFNGNLQRVAVVFPNKRAAIFMDEYLAQQTRQPLWSPAYTTISDLFRSHSSLTVGDHLMLISLLYQVFYKHTREDRIREGMTDESLDKFWGWGELLLSDFDDIDKNLAPAAGVFRELKNYHALDGDPALSEQQIESLNKIFSEYRRENHDTALQRRFERLWSHLYDIYADYQTVLRSHGTAYEGMLYRDVIGQADLNFEYDAYLFVGFNMMQSVERELCKKIEAAGKQVRYYWDYDHYYLDNPINEAGHYIRQYLPHLKNALPDNDADIYANFSKPKDITYISVQTANIQARYISRWLRENNRIRDGKRTAIVLADESLLPTVIHSLPNEVDKVNITTGFPLSQTPVASLVSLLFRLQTEGNPGHGDIFRLRHVNDVLRHPLARYISPGVLNLRKELITRRSNHLRRSQLQAGDDGRKLLFSAIYDGAEGNGNLQLIGWMQEIVKYIGAQALAEAEQNGETENPLLQESVFRMYTLLNRMRTLIEQGYLEVETSTLQKLLTQLIASTTIPFHGEPAIGVQIMGVLETRNLDFDHVLVLSCNEGNMPRDVNDSSFIPYSIRKAYELTTIDNKVAIYAYYFNRLLQRAGDVTLMYNSSTEGTHTGEMSRFMLQLMVESNHPIRRITLQAEHGSVEQQQHSEIAKSQTVLNILDAVSYLSPSAVNDYLRCPAKFYYHYVVKLQEPDNEDNEIDNILFGTIFHEVCQKIYESYIGQTVDSRIIDNILKSKDVIPRLVDEAIARNLFNISGSMPRNGIEFNGLQLINRQVIMDFVRRQLNIDKAVPFRIVALEEKIIGQIAIGGGRNLQIGGIVDRLDEIDGYLRVADYKTGKAPTGYPADVADIFTFNKRKHTDYYLQTLFYCSLIRHNETYNPQHLKVSPSLLFVQKKATHPADYMLRFSKDRKSTPIEDIADCEDEFRENLTRVLTEIFNPNVPFALTSDADSCQYCPYRNLCNR